MSVALLVETIALAVLASTIPFLWYRAFRTDARIDGMDKKIDTLDEAVAYLAELQQVPEARVHANGQLPAPPQTAEARRAAHQRWVAGKE